MSLDITSLYDVDPTTFAPIAARFEFHDGQTNVRVRFATFERLPSTAANARLLKIPSSAVKRVSRPRTARSGPRR